MSSIIKPDEHEFRELKQKVEETVDSYSYSVEADNVEFYIGFQHIETAASVIGDGDSYVDVIANPEQDWEEEVEVGVLRSLLEIEFLKKTDYNVLQFTWQEIARDAYVWLRLKELSDFEFENRELEIDWEQLKDDILEEEMTERLFANIGIVSEKIGEELAEEHSKDEIPRLKRSDIVEAGDRAFQ